MSELFDAVDALVASRSPLPPPAERRRLRQAHALTLDEVAVALDVRRATVGAWAFACPPDLCFNELACCQKTAAEQRMKIPAAIIAAPQGCRCLIGSGMTVAGRAAAACSRKAFKSAASRRAGASSLATSATTARSPA